MDPFRDVENALQQLSGELTSPAVDECLYCYLRRMLKEFGCTNDHRFTERWALGRRVRGRPVLEWAQDTGGCCCDCEVLTNSFGRRSTRRQGLLCADARADLEALDRKRAGLPALVAGESVALMNIALEGVNVTRHGPECAQIAISFVGLAGAALYRALLRVEAERAVAEADALRSVMPVDIPSPDQRRRDAAVDLFARIRSAPGGRGLDTSKL